MIRPRCQVYPRNANAGTTALESRMSHCRLRSDGVLLRALPDELPGRDRAGASPDGRPARSRAEGVHRLAPGAPLPALAALGPGGPEGQPRLAGHSERRRTWGSLSCPRKAGDPLGEDSLSVAGAVLWVDTPFGPYRRRKDRRGTLRMRATSPFRSHRTCDEWNRPTSQQQRGGGPDSLHPRRGGILRRVLERADGLRGDQRRGSEGVLNKAIMPMFCELHRIVS
jgi:hypothetical protein